MPTVPTIRPVTTALGAMPTPRLQGEATAAQFGAPVGEGLRDIASVAAKIFQSEMDKQNEARVIEARNAESMASIQDRKRLAESRGKEADTVFQALATERQKRIAESEAKLSNDVQKQAFRRWADQEHLDFVERGTNHVMREGERYADEQSAASETLAVERIKNDRADPDRVKRIDAETINDIWKHGHLKQDPPDKIELRIAKFRRDSILGAAGADMDAGDLAAARARITDAKQRGLLGDADAVDALAKLDNAERDTTAMRAADRIFLTSDRGEEDLQKIIAGDKSIDADAAEWTAKDVKNRDEFTRRARDAIDRREKAKDAADERELLGIIDRFNKDSGSVAPADLAKLSPRSRAAFDKWRSKTFDPIEQEAIKMGFLLPEGRDALRKRDFRKEFIEGTISKETYELGVDKQRKLLQNDVPTVDDAVNRGMIRDELDNASESLGLGVGWKQVKDKLDKGKSLNDDEKRYVLATQEVYNALATESEGGFRKANADDVRKAVGSLLTKRNRWTSNTEKEEVTGMQAIEETRKSWPDGYEARARAMLAREGDHYPTTDSLDIAIKDLVANDAKKKAASTKPAAETVPANEPPAVQRLLTAGSEYEEKQLPGVDAWLFSLFKD